MFCWPCISVNLVNKTNLVHNLFLVYLSISTCFGRVFAHHQEKELCFCDTWFSLFCVNDCLPDQYISIFSIFINLYMFRTKMCPSSAERTVFMWHLVLVILCECLVCWSICSYIPDQYISILSIFINLYMFRATICPSSVETAVFMWHLVLVILCEWLSARPVYLVYLSISTCFGRLCAHHQEKELFYVTLGTCYSVWMSGMQEHMLLQTSILVY